MGRSGISLAGVRRSLEEGERGAVSAPQVVLALQDREVGVRWSSAGDRELVGSCDKEAGAARFLQCRQVVH
jgi:hypothetical protein